ncbi:MAG: DegT/DnrJ/EryC1/StrS family aminotransferase [Chromatiales bacterium]|nr:DegT/DnrJ/EryC1/StrS family aminotransferase [Chromatiales bacterium]
MIDLGRQHRPLRDELLAVMTRILDDTAFIGGSEVQALEQEVSAVLGTRHAIGVNSGTDALQLALRAAGIGPGDEVITTPFSFVATASVICHTGATPVFADIDAATFNIDPQAVAAAITPATRAILPVHLFGQPAAMDRLGEIAAAHGLALIEDCAQSFGADIEGRMTGAIGTAAAFSFYPTKNLGACGDGGLVVTQSDELAARLRRLANHGVGAPLEYVDVGYNSRLDGLQAAVLRVKLRHIARWNLRRREIAARYDTRLAGLPLRQPVAAPGRSHIYHHYTILLDDRDAVAAALASEGIGSALHYRQPIHLQPAFRHHAPEAGLPVAEDTAARCLSLPMYPELLDEEVDRVADALARILS